MRSHLVPIVFQVAAVVFEIAEEDAIFQIYGIVLDIAFENLVQNLGQTAPSVTFEPLFGCQRLSADHHRIARMIGNPSHCAFHTRPVSVACHEQALKAS